MPDLLERLRDVDQLTAPDLWADVESRVASEETAVIRLVDPPRPSRSSMPKVLTIAAAFLIVALAFGWFLRSLSEAERPATTPPPTAAPTSVTFQGARGRIAFLGDGRMEAVDGDLDGQTTITIARDAAAPIAWSPDGRRLLLINGTILDEDGTIHQIASPGTFGGGSFSPDGRHVVYSDDGDLFVADSDGEAKHRLAASMYGSRHEDVLGGAYWPAWAPDGTRIAYVARAATSSPSAVGAGYWTIRTMDVDGGASRTLLDKGLPRTKPFNSAEVASLDWSPDGSQLLFSIAPNNPATSSAVWVYEPGSGLRRLTPPNGSLSPTWSPDGARIAFTQGTHLMLTDTDVRSRPEAIPGVAIESPFVAWNPIPPSPH